jgi:hypothetical protein
MKILKTVLMTAIALLMFSSTNAQPSMGAVLPTGKKVLIQSAVSFGRNNEGFWEKPGGGALASKGDNIRIWSLDGAETKRFTLLNSSRKGWYEITIGENPNARIDVSGGKFSNGSNIQIWEKNGTESQMFLFKHLGDGRYKIYTKDGKIVNLQTPNSSKNGNNVQLWSDNKDLHSEWYILDAATKKPILPVKNTVTAPAKLHGTAVPNGTYYVQSAMSYKRSNKGFMELPGKESEYYRKGNQLGIYTKDTNPNKLFYIKKNRETGYYKLFCGGKRLGADLAVDLKAGKAVKGTPAHSWTINTGQGQDFFFKHLGGGRFKICPRTGGVLCLEDNKNDNNGNKVHVWDDHNAISTEWYLINKETGEIFIP